MSKKKNIILHVKNEDETQQKNLNLMILYQQNKSLIKLLFKLFILMVLIGFKPSLVWAVSNEVKNNQMNLQKYIRSYFSLNDWRLYLKDGESDFHKEKIKPILISASVLLIATGFVSTIYFYEQQKSNATILALKKRLIKAGYEQFVWQKKLLVTQQNLESCSMLLSLANLKLQRKQFILDLIRSRTGTTSISTILIYNVLNQTKEIF